LAISDLMKPSNSAGLTVTGETPSLSALGHSRPMHSALALNNIRFAPKATERALLNIHQLSVTFDAGAGGRIVVRGIYCSGLQHCKKTHNQLHPQVFYLERAKGIEPSYAAWEAAVLPLNYARASRP
jgi:hypothetical protein